MTDNTGSGHAPDTQGATLLQKPGELIRSKREAAGMTQAQVGEALHLTVHYIKSLENDEYGKLPGLTFVKGYMRSYARLLKLDEVAIIECYDKYVASLGLQETTQEQSIRVRRRNDQAVLWAVVAGVILVIGLGAGWWFVGRDDAEAASTVVAVRTPAPVSTTVAQSSQTQSPQLQTPQTQTPVAPAAVRQEPFTGQVAAAVSAEAAGSEFSAADSQFSAAGTAAALDASADAVASPPNTTTLMTEDGPVVLDNAPGDAVTTTAALAAAGEALVEAAAPDAAQSVTGDVIAVDDLGAAGESGAAGDLAAAADAAVDIAATTASAPAVIAAQTDPSAAAALATASTGTNTRRVELVGNGADQLELQFAGNSWVEVDDSARVRLYSDMMRDGDALSIKAAAPFHILLGDATGVSVLLNGQPLPIAANIRSDKTARIMISAEGVSAWAVE
jgi:cytoskeleton protein RodZ